MAAKIWEIQHFSEALHVTSLVPTVFKICPWRENNFWEKLPVDEYCIFFSIFTQKFKILHRSRDKCVFTFYSEIQDGRQKWREGDFCEMSPLHSADTLRVKTFPEIALSYTVSKINAFLRFTKKFKMGAKNGGKAIFGKSRQ